MNNNDSAAIENAEQVIERFGGIRPMASKIDVPVTTIQGWKKRNIIPGTRREDIMRAAREHNVDISDIVSDRIASSTANQNMGVRSYETPAAAKPVSFGAALNETRKESSGPAAPAPVAASAAPLSASSGVDSTYLDRKLAAMERKAVTKSTAVTLILIALAIGAVFVLLWPRMQQSAPALQHDDGRVAALEKDVEALRKENDFLTGLIPQNLEQRLNDLQQQTQEVREGMGAALTKAQTISQDVLGQDAGPLEERIAKLEAHISEVAGSPEVAALLERFNVMRGTDLGKARLGQSVSELSALVSGLQADSADQINIVLDTARERSEVLGETLGGVPKEDLKAAAMLLAMSQMRTSLGRDKQPFADDLQVLMGLVGEDDPQLKASLEKLAPQAEQGVLTPDGLNSEFRTMTGDILMASLRGENVSVRERAQARLAELFQIQKKGEPLTGTDTQVALAKTQGMLDEGDVEGALNEMQLLQGPAAKAAQPWIMQAQMTLMAQRLKERMTQTINVSAYGPKALTANGILGGKLVQDKKSGINILTPDKASQGFNLPAPPPQ